MNKLVARIRQSLDSLLASAKKTSLFAMGSEQDQKLSGFLDAVKDEAVEHQEKAKRKIKQVRYAILLSYQGKNYFGMQIQKDEPTIESHLLRSLREHGMITEEQEKKPFSFYFQRAARTDRAVSAVRQLCSMQLPLDEDFVRNGTEELNKHLPKDIRVVGIKRTTPSFHAQKSCDSRTYSYTMPTFAFAELDKLTNYDYRITPSRIEEINDVLTAYVGTHNFFNYTSRKDFDDRSCFRYIMSFECREPFFYRDEFRKKDVEFITIYVKGQSFILHQIRKMVGMTVSVVRGLAYRSDILKSFESKRMDVPRAPGLGLLLEQLHYDVYDKKYALSHSSLNDWGPEVEGRVKEVRDSQIVSEILRAECHTQGMLQWLATLPHHRFACDPEDELGESVTKLRDAHHLAKTVAHEATENTEEQSAASSAAPDEEPEEKKARLSC